MTALKILNPKINPYLYGYSNKFIFFKNLIQKQKLPQSIMISGDKGIGKETFVNHLLHFYFDKQNYNEKDNYINDKSIFHNQFINDLFPNIIYFESFNLKKINIDDIRKLKKNLLKKPIIDDKRFIIFDEVESFNNNCLNALLKIIEEPGKNNYFIFINNKTKPILSTVRSRCLEIKFILNNKNKKEITSSLLDYFNQKILIKDENMQMTPGNFIKFNHILDEHKINLKEDILTNSKIILNLYKKEKNFIYRDLLLFLSNYYYYKIKFNNNCDKIKFIEEKEFIFKNINEFFTFNLSQNSLLHFLEEKFNNE